MTLYDELQQNNVPTDHHESDLYVLDTTEARRLIAKHGMTIDHRNEFTSNKDGRAWIELPFQYTPFWTSRQGTNATCS